MASYNPIFLTASEQEVHDLRCGLDVLFDYLVLDERDAVPIYVRRLGDAIEIRSAQGSLESLTIVSAGKSGARPKRMSVSCDGEHLNIRLDNRVYHIYFATEKDHFES